MSAESLGKRFADLQGRLNTLQDATGQLNDLIQRLAHFDFQPGSVPLAAAEDDNVGAELASEINQILREQEEELELSHEEIKDIHPGSQHEKTRLTDAAERLEHELLLCRRSFRKAQITAKRNLQLAQRQERDLLYASFSSPPSRPQSSPAEAAPAPAASLVSRRKPTARSELSKEEQMIGSSHDVTQSMRRAHEMMAAELAKSDYARNTLEESTATLGQLSENYSSLDTMLSSSRALLGTLLKSQKTDTWYLQSAFYLLVVTIGWLVFRRLLWGPTWWLVWLPLKMIFRMGVGVTNTVGLTGPRPPADCLDSLRPGSQQARMNNGDVPTMAVDEPLLRQSGAAEDEGSMVEQVGKTIDESEHGGWEGAQKQEETILRERDAPAEAPNPKKRTMEEELAGAVSERPVKDEL